jgi:cytoskeleton protein RodZ
MTLEPETHLSGPARVGHEMRYVRERLGWRLADVAAELRIRLPYLEAIERGELSALPGAAYQTGFVRTYAQALGLDGDEILRRFRAEGTGFVPKAELTFLAPVPDRAVPTGAIVLLGVLLVLGGYGFWYHHTSQEAQLAAQIPAIPTELAPLAVPPKPPAAVAPQKTAAVVPPPAQAVPPPASSVPQQTAAAPPAPATAVTQTGAPLVPQAAAPPPTAALPPPPPTAPTPQAAAAASAAAPSTPQTIEATGDSWVQVADAKGNILFSKTMHQGDTWPVPNLPGLVLTSGNAGATVIDVNGQPGSPLGSTGSVLRNFALTAPAPVQPASATLPVTITPGPVEGPSPSGPAHTN